VLTNNIKELNEHNESIGRNYTKETIDRFKEALVTLRRAAVFAQRIDWLVSCDDGEETFHKRLAESLKQLENE
jgi:hypothetical protein